MQSWRLLAVIGPTTNAIIRRIALPWVCAPNHGLLLDDAAQPAFIACDGNARPLLLNLWDWRVVSVHTLGKDPDVLAFDATRNLLYIASESGVISLLGVSGQDVRKLWQGHSGDNAHSMAIDPSTGLLHVPNPQSRRASWTESWRSRCRRSRGIDRGRLGKTVRRR